VPNGTPPSLKQKVAMSEEVRTAIRLIDEGLAALQRITGSNDFYHLPMLLLAGGYERLMKCLLCLAHLARRGRFPKFEYIKTPGHNLPALLSMLVDEVFLPGYANSRVAAQDDLRFLRGDARLGQLIDLVSQFAQSARYHDLDVIVGGPSKDDDPPKRTWDEIEQAVLHDLGLEKGHEAGKLDEVYRQLIRELVIRFERFTRALCRLFTLADLGPLAGAQTGAIRRFLFLLRFV
jgi:hypothetical protein